MKISFLGAGSTIFSKNVLGDVMLCPALRDAELALYDIDQKRLEESALVIERMNQTINGGRAKVRKYLGIAERKEALRGANFVICAIQVGGYTPCTVIDFEIPKQYGLRQTIGDTLGIGGIFRALRTIPVLRDIAEDMQSVCPDAWFLNYSNPMAMLTGYLLQHTGIKAVGLCHSVQVCVPLLLEWLGLDWKVENLQFKIAGINHMAWLLELKDGCGKDLYPEIRRLAKAKNAAGKHNDMVRFDYIDKLGYYCTESSEHNAEYNPFYIKAGRDDLIEKFNIPLDEYPRRCEKQIEQWTQQWQELSGGAGIEHVRSNEYASHIMEAMVANKPYTIGGNVLNHGVISNLPWDACVEVPCLVDRSGVTPTYVGALPLQLAAMNSSNIYPQLLTIDAAYTGKRETVYQAAMMDPHTGAQLSTDEIVALCDDLFAAHAKAGYLSF